MTPGRLVAQQRAGGVAVAARVDLKQAASGAVPTRQPRRVGDLTPTGLIRATDRALIDVVQDLLIGPFHARRPGRLVVRADDPSPTPYAGLAASGELARRLGLAGLIDGELGVERRARPVRSAAAACRPANWSSAWRSTSWSADRSLITSRMSAPTGRARGCAPSPIRRRRAQRCSTPSAFAAVICSVSSVRSPAPASVLPGRWAAIRQSR